MSLDQVKCLYYELLLVVSYLVSTKTLLKIMGDMIARISLLLYPAVSTNQRC